MLKKVRIATRESALALWQAEHVAACLRAQFPELEVQLLPMTTRGDQILDRPLSQIGGKGLFLKELEVAMLEGRADLAVHSLKDVPMQLESGFVLAAVMARENPLDALVSNHYSSLDALPVGGIVGSSSLRRKLQLLRQRPDLRVVDLRGNLQTRLRKLDDNQFDAIILAAAGLIRLGQAERIRAELPAAIMLPAAGQGALGLECLADAHGIRALLAPLADPLTTSCTRAERAFAERLGGSCQVPIAAFAQELANSPTTLRLRGLIGTAPTDLGVASNWQGEFTGLLQAPEELGLALAEQLLAQGAPSYRCAM